MIRSGRFSYTRFLASPSRFVVSFLSIPPHLSLAQFKVFLIIEKNLGGDSFIEDTDSGEADGSSDEVDGGSAEYDGPSKSGSKDAAVVYKKDGSSQSYRPVVFTSPDYATSHLLRLKITIRSPAKEMDEAYYRI